MQPRIDLELLTDPFCILSRERDFSIWLSYRLHHEEAINVVTTGSIFDPATTFTKDRIEIIDIKTGEQACFPAQMSADEDTRSKETTLTLSPEQGSYFLWSTNPEVKWHKYPLDISGLCPNTKYAVKYRNHGFVGWSPVHQDAQSDIEVQSGSIGINLLNDVAPSFTTRTFLPPKPPVTSSLSTSVPICSLSGVPSLTIFLDWKLDGDRPICALMTQSGGFNIGLEIRDPERKGRRIGPSPDWFCGDEEESRQAEEYLLRFEQGKAFQQSYTLSVEAKENGLLHSDTWNLVSGKTYRLTLRKSKWRWLYEDELEAAVLQDEAKLRSILSEEPRVEWKPECRAEICAD